MLIVRLALSGLLEIVVIIAARLVAEQAPAANVQPVPDGAAVRQQVLLDLHGLRQPAAAAFVELAFFVGAPVFMNAGLDGLQEIVRGAGLGEKPENVALVHGLNGRAEIRTAREQHAHRLRRDLPGPAEKFDPIHAGHAVIRDDHGEGAVAPEHFKPFGAAFNGLDGHLLSQLSLESRQYLRIVIHKKHSVRHVRSPLNRSRDRSPPMRQTVPPRSAV